MTKVVFNSPTTLPSVPPAQVTFNAPFQVVEVELRQPSEYGRNAGREGLGCQFFGESDGTLYSILLDMNPYSLVDTPPMSLLQPIRNHIRTHATPGTLSLASFPNVELVADAVWLYKPFGAALWSFDSLVIEPVDAFLQSSACTIYVEVGQGVIIGLHRKTRALRCIFVEGFDRHQYVFNTSISDKTHDATFIELLNYIHWNYYADPELVPDIPNPIENLLLNSSLPKLLRDLISSYIEDLGSGLIN